MCQKPLRFETIDMGCPWATPVTCPRWWPTFGVSISSIRRRDANVNLDDPGMIQGSVVSDLYQMYPYLGGHGLRRLCPGNPLPGRSDEKVM